MTTNEIQNLLAELVRNPGGGRALPYIRSQEGLAKSHHLRS